MPLHLKDVTLTAVTAVNHELTVRAMNACLGHCSFADVVLVTDRHVKAPFRVEVIEGFPDGTYYAPFICRQLTRYTPSAFNLLVQYDGYITDPGAWSDSFLDFDYIGAKWPWHPPRRRVGNSGFCLRSKKLLDILATLDLPPRGSFVDDTFICVTVREWLEKNHNIKIGSEEIADSFAYERHVPDRSTFGFHGIFNFWRHTSDSEMLLIPGLLDDLYIPWRGFVEVMLHYYVQRNLDVFGAWFQRLFELLGKEQVETHLLGYVDDRPYIYQLIETGQTLIRSQIRE